MKDEKFYTQKSHFKCRCEQFLFHVLWTCSAREETVLCQICRGVIWWLLDRHCHRWKAFSGSVDLKWAKCSPPISTKFQQVRVGSAFQTAVVFLLFVQRSCLVCRKRASSEIYPIALDWNPSNKTSIPRMSAKHSADPRQAADIRGKNYEVAAAALPAPKIEETYCASSTAKEVTAVKKSYHVWGFVLIWGDRWQVFSPIRLSGEQKAINSGWPGFSLIIFWLCMYRWECA